MREGKLDTSIKEQSKTRSAVGNSTNLWGQKTQYAQKKILTSTNYRFDPYLFAAIFKRNVTDLKSSIGLTESNAMRATLSEEQHNVFKSIYYEIDFDPIKLAMKLANNETSETTKNNEATRLDVLYALAKYFDELCDSAQQKGNSLPELSDVLSYAKKLGEENQDDNFTILHLFILGLSDKNKAIAESIVNDLFSLEQETSRNLASPAA
ncbi:MAG: hypothetical protein KDH94_04805 [Coxiellaceae bacterium]|nr:hypothetical protein [Coxiellaceae bacterium]